VQVLKTKGMIRFARRERISDSRLLEAIQRIELGLIDADLGGGLIKQRVAREGQGRSGGYRVIIGYRVAHRAVLLFGFAKNERENIEPAELATLREAGSAWLSAMPKQIAKAIEDGVLQEIRSDE